MIPNAAEITQFARTPTSCAIRKSSVEARSWMPSDVRLINTTIPSNKTPVTIQVTISSFESRTPETLNWVVSQGYGSTPF